MGNKFKMLALGTVFAVGASGAAFADLPGSAMLVSGRVLSGARGRLCADNPVSGAAAGANAGAAQGAAAAGPVGAIVGGALGTAGRRAFGDDEQITGAPVGLRLMAAAHRLRLPLMVRARPVPRLSGCRYPLIGISRRIANSAGRRGRPRQSTAASPARPPPSFGISRDRSRSRCPAQRRLPGILAGFPSIRDGHARVDLMT